MSLPTTRSGLTDLGWRFSSRSSCRACEKKIEWWKTPDGRNAPMSIVLVEGCEEIVSHFSDCEKHQQFRRMKAIKTTRAIRVQPKSGSLFE